MFKLLLKILLSENKKLMQLKNDFLLTKLDGGNIFRVKVKFFPMEVSLWT